MPLQTLILSNAANQARGLAIDAVHKCSSGHLGLPLGAAEIGAVLFGSALSFNPDAPRWLNRDRFVLSAGHGSMFIYSWLHLAGYDLPIEEVKNFRVLHSKTPGHPEFHETPGVECTTGPLGQGVANATGLALSIQAAAARFNTAEHTLFDSHVIALAGDGCLQEGVALEAISFAAHQKLDNLILIYDSNDVTLDAMANKSQSGDDVKRFKAIGWDVQLIDGHDLLAIAKAIAKAKKATGKPQLIIAKTIIGKGIPEVAGTSKGHGEGVAKGAYIAVKETAELTHILLASGSELQYAVNAAKILGAGVRVVSVPCFERFNRQSCEYRESVLPIAVRKRVAIEAGVTGLWYQYVGLDGKVIGIDRFGISAPGATVFKELGITTEAVVQAAQSL